MDVKKRIGKNDIIIIGIAMVALTVFCVIFYLGHRQQGAEVVVTVDGTEYGRYSLEQEQTIDIGGTNELIIRDGRADMTWADCPDQLCVHQRAISRDGENLVCLPNEVVVTVISDEKADLDAVAQ